MDSSALERPFNFENAIFLLQLATFNANHQISLSSPPVPVHGDVSEGEGTFYSTWKNMHKFFLKKRQLYRTLASSSSEFPRDLFSFFSFLQLAYHKPWIPTVRIGADLAYFRRRTNPSVDCWLVEMSYGGRIYIDTGVIILELS